MRFLCVASSRSRIFLMQKKLIDKGVQKMKITERITLKADTMATIAVVLKNNLFALQEESWLYTDDNEQAAMNITYRIEGDEVVFDVWMIDEEMQVLLDKVMKEI